MLGSKGTGRLDLAPWQNSYRHQLGIYLVVILTAAAGRLRPVYNDDAIKASTSDLHGCKPVRVTLFAFQNGSMNVSAL